MIVLDASAALELLLGTERGRLVRRRLVAAGGFASAPMVIDLEICGALRRLTNHQGLDARRAEMALDDLRALPVERFRHEPLIARIWSIRATVSHLDAAYVALAEALDVPLITCDGRLARSHGHVARVERIDASVP